MSISKNDNSYSSEAKQQWRDRIYSLLAPNSCNQLVDDDNKYKYKWLELVGDNAVTFNQLLNTGRIEESQLIGIDIREYNIAQCKTLFPQASFHSTEWNSFCRTYDGNDIGVIVFDSYTAAYGKEFEHAIDATMNLALRCRERIGECLVVVNVDGSKTYRGNACHKGKTSKEVLKENLEKAFQYSDSVYLRSYEVSIDSMYEYRQHKMTTTMLSCGILL